MAKKNTYQRWLDALEKGDHDLADRLIPPRGTNHHSSCGCDACGLWAAAYESRSYASILY